MHISCVSSISLKHGKRESRHVLWIWRAEDSGHGNPGVWSFREAMEELAYRPAPRGIHFLTNFLKNIVFDCCRTWWRDLPNTEQETFICYNNRKNPSFHCVSPTSTHDYHRQTVTRCLFSQHPCSSEISFRALRLKFPPPVRKEHLQSGLEVAERDIGMHLLSRKISQPKE